MASNPVANVPTGKLGPFPFVLAGMSFIPMIGILFGAASIIWGVLSKKEGRRKLVTLGASGIVFTVIIYSALFYFGFVQRGGIYDSLRTTMAQSNLNSAVPLIEYFKAAHGEYPETLDAVAQGLPKDSISRISLFDPRVMPAKGEQHYFYYRRIDQTHYYLRGVAPDGKPFSPGALVPQVEDNAAHLGLMIDPPSSPSSEPSPSGR